MDSYTQHNIGESFRRGHRSIFLRQTTSNNRSDKVRRSLEHFITSPKLNLGCNSNANHAWTSLKLYGPWRPPQGYRVRIPAEAMFFLSFSERSLIDGN